MKKGKMNGLFIFLQLFATPGYAAICQHRSTLMGHLKTTTVNMVIFKKQGWNVKN